MLYKNGKEVKEQSITVNNPMTYGATTFYQTSFGQAAQLRVTDKDGNLIYDDSIDLGIYRASTNPDAPAGVIDLTPSAFSSISSLPMKTEKMRPMLDTLNLQSGQMYVQARNLGSNASAAMPDAVINQGEPLQIGDYTVEFVRENRYTLLQVASNPGVPIFWTAAFLLVGGLVVTFYFPHRRIRAIFDQKRPARLDSARDGATGEARLVRAEGLPQFRGRAFEAIRHRPLDSGTS